MSVFLLVVSMFAVRSMALVACTNETDAFGFLYVVCFRSPVCRAKYSLTMPIESVSQSSNAFLAFKKTARDAVFVMQAIDADASSTVQATQAASAMYAGATFAGGWFSPDLPLLHVAGDPTAFTVTGGSVYDCTTAAAASLAVMPELETLAARVLGIMVTHAAFLRDDEICSDPGERAVFDPEDGSFRCACLDPDHCGEGIAHRIVIDVMLSAVLVVLFLGVVANVIAVRSVGRRFDDWQTLYRPQQQLPQQQSRSFQIAAKRLKTG